MMIKNLGLSYQSFGINREALLANVKAWPSASTNFAIAMATTIGTLKRKEQNKFNTHLSEKLDHYLCSF